MNINKKVLSAVVLVIVLIIIFSFAKSNNHKVIKIGVVAPLKAGATVYGDNLVKGIQLAHADLGSKASQYEVIVEDDEGNVGKSASAAQKLINIDGVKAIISVSSGTGNAVQKVASQYGIAHICDCVDISIASSTGFIYSVLPQNESKTWLAEASSRGIKTVYLITQNHPGTNLIREEVIKSAKDYGVTVVGDVKIDGAQRDFKTDVVKIKGTPADVYLTIVFPPTLDILAKEMTIQGITNFSSVGLLAISSDLSVFEGKWYTDNYLADQSYFDRFIKAYPSTRFNARTAPHGYDIFNMIVKGNESGNIVEYIKGLNEYNGMVGRAQKIDNKNIFSLPLSIWQIKDGKVVQIGAGK